MVNILHVDRTANKITLGTTGTTINIASHTASKILALDGSKDLEVVTIGTSLDYTRPTLNTVQDIRITASPEFASIELGHADDTTITRVGAGVIAVEGVTVAMVGDAPTAHSIASHDDTTGTGVELNTLTDGSDVGALHSHAAAYQPLDDVLTDLAVLTAVANDEFIVGTGAGVYAHESGTTVRTSMGLGTTDIPQFRGLGLGEAGGIGEIQITGSANHIHRVDMENTSDGNAARAGFTARSDEASFTADAYSSNHASSPNMVTFRADTDTDFRIQNFGIGAALGTITIVVGAEFMITPVAGSGYFTFTGTDVRLGDFCELRFYDDGANYVGFKAPALTANQIWVLPDADGGANELLKTDGSGNLSWTATAPPGAHMHDGDTLQLDAINSNGGAFAFTTSGIVTFSESVTMSNGKDLTIAGHIIFNTNNSYIGFNNPRITFNDTNDRLDITGGIVGSATATFEGASVTVGKASTTTGTLILHDSNSANTITLTVPDITAGSLTFTLPPTDGDNTNVLQTDGNGVLTWVAAGGGGTDEKVKIDSGATADYIGAVNNDGVLRTGTSLSYTDGGNFVTINAIQDIQTSASPTFAALNLTAAFSITYTGGTREWYSYQTGDSYVYAPRNDGDTDVDWSRQFRINGATGGVSINNSGVGFTALTIGGTITLKEQATADGDTATYGQDWVKNTSPCTRWFTDDVGNDGQMMLMRSTTISSDSDAMDVQGCNVLWVDTSSGNVVLGGLANGVDNQLLYVFKYGEAGILTIEHQEGTGTQKFMLNTGNYVYDGVGVCLPFICKGGTWYIAAYPRSFAV